MAASLKFFLSIVGLLFFFFMLLCGFSPSTMVEEGIQIFLGLYMFFVVARTIFFFFGAFREKLNHLKLDALTEDEKIYPMVSVLVPCYNEADVIEHSLNHLLKIQYPNYEVIVIDDGSNDATFAKASFIASQAAFGRVKVISQVNAGKAAALNHGLQHAVGDLIMCVDADSRLTPGSIEAGARHFINPKIGAVAGYIEIAKQDTHLLKLQQLEYLVGLNFTRRAMSFLGLVPIVPGPAGLFRREAIYDAGGLYAGKEMFAEDAELTLRLLAKGWEIKSEEHMVAVTEAPETPMALLRQRYRWNRGTYQSLAKNFKELIRSNGWKGFYLASYLWTETVVTPTINFGLLLYFFGYFVRTGEIQLFTTWYFYLLALDLMTTMLVTYRHGHVWRWMLYTLFNKIWYYYFLLTWKIFCLHEEWHEKKMSWDKLERTGQLEST